jgi:hypothetical protein
VVIDVAKILTDSDIKVLIPVQFGEIVFQKGAIAVP